MKHLEVVAAILEYDGKILCMTVHHDYPDFSISLHAFHCVLDTPDFIRKEHVDAKWMAPEDLPTLDWAPADVPIMRKLAGK